VTGCDLENLRSLMIQAVQVHQQGRLAEAMVLYRKVLALDPRQPEAHNNRGVIQRSLGQAGAAEASYRDAIAIKPDYVDAHTNLANLLRKTRPAEALLFYERANALKPDNANILYNYAATLLELDRQAEAANAYRRAIAIRPQFAEAWSNLGVALADLSELQQANEAYRRAIALKPDLVQAYTNLGLVLQEQGLPEEAITAFDSALKLKPASFADRTNRIFAELYRPGVRLSDVARLSMQSEQTMVPEARVSPASPRRPKVGFVSADFRHHAAGLLVISALEGLSQLGFELFCYSSSPRSDALTIRFQNAATWRPAWGLSDDELAAQIRDDGIDILFDLSGFSRGHRLGVFARRAAPIQIAWVGYPATTGLSTIDYLLSDHWQAPLGADNFYSEKLLRLTHPYICFDPPPDAPEPGALPALKNGFITFGSFNALKKVNSQVISLWSRVLAELPEARLLLKSPAFDCPGTKAQALLRFRRAGVASEQLTILGGSSPEEHLAAMVEADVALDTFPYSGGITTLEALWMGQPVITWPGETMASRHSFAYLSAAGLAEFAVPDADAYVALAVGLARDPSKLSELRAGMRVRIQSSPLTDKSGFCVELAKVLEDIFHSRSCDLH